MSKKRKRTGRCAAERARRASTGQVRAAGRDGVLWRQTAEEATLAAKPRYNGYACGHGAHGDAKYSRAKAKRAWRAQIGREGASRGSFLFLAYCGKFGAVPNMKAVRVRTTSYTEREIPVQN